MEDSNLGLELHDDKQQETKKETQLQRVTTRKLGTTGTNKGTDQ